MKNIRIVFIPFVMLVTALGSYSFRTVPAAGWKEISLTEYDKLANKASAFFDEKKSYSVDVTMRSFKTHTSTQPQDEQKGYMIKSGKNYHSFFMGLHTYQNNKYLFVIDSTEKNIMVKNAAGESEDRMLTDMYKNFRSYVTKAYSTEITGGTKIKIVLDGKVRVSHIEMEMDKNGFIKKSTAYFTVQIRENPQDPNSSASTPRVETVLSDYKTYSSLDKKEFSETDFFTTVNGKLTPAPKYKAYYIKDSRLQ